MSNIEVVGPGALNIDYLYRVERILDDGEAVVNEAKSFPGDSPYLYPILSRYP